MKCVESVFGMLDMSIMEVRSTVEEELNRHIHPPDEIQEFPKSAVRIAAIIKDADEREIG